MNSHPESSASASSRHSRHGAETDMKRIVTSAFAVLEQTPPPTLREILGAYKSKGDGDRDMLLAMLNAKTAEDQRLASVAALQRSVLEAYQSPPPSAAPPPPRSTNHYYQYPTPNFTQSPPLREQRHPRRAHHRDASRSRSPYRTYTHLPSMRDTPAVYAEPPRKRRRSSRSPPPPPHHAVYESHSEQLPPSPYSSSARSDSAEYSPRSRASMAIGSLLSSGPRKETNGDDI